MIRVDYPGVYQITNTENGRIYIGSSRRVLARRYEHFRTLEKGEHVNKFLQEDFDKFGKLAFEWSLLEKTEDLLRREQFHIVEASNLYNVQLIVSDIWRSRPGKLTRKEFYQEYSSWLKKVKTKEIDLKDVPDKFICSVKSALSRIPWNKGKQYKSTDHLKVPKSKVGNYEGRKNTARSKSPKIEVWDGNGKLLGTWRSPTDLEEWSYSEKNTLPINGRNKVPRRGVPVKVLQAYNTSKSAKNGKSYKGLFFKFQIAPVSGNINSGGGELGGSPPLKDNPEPSFTEM